MNEIKQWAYGITVSAIVGAIILLVSPGGTLDKLVRTAVSLFLMCAILSPFLSDADPFKFTEGLKSPDNFSNEYGKEETNEYLQNSIEKNISDILEESGIKDADIRISINIDNNNEMSIESVEISANKIYENNFENAERNLKNKLGIEVKIEVKK